MTSEYFTVAVNSPFNNSILTYLPGDYSSLPCGALVKVPLGKRTEKGCIIKKYFDIDNNVDGIEYSKIRPIEGLYCNKMAVSKEDLELYQWIANYYHYSLGQCIFDVLPKSLKRPRKLNFISGKGLSFEFSLNIKQKEIIKKIKDKLDDGFSKWLIHGITGSGKTVIYLEIIKEVLNRGRSVLFLLPEINLTPQFLETFYKYLDVQIFTYNSSISNSDKFELWRLLQKDDGPKIIVGVRSSIFLPIKNLGLIVVDEEHDQSFKQEDRCRYNARDVALKKGSIQKFPVIMGSATPSLETYYKFTNLKELASNYFFISKRAGEALLPAIKLSDAKINGEFNKAIWPFDNKALLKIKDAIGRKEQVLIFVNRLGFANFLQCRACGHQFVCPNCSINLRYFKKRNQVSCQYCEYKSKAPEICPECHNMNIYQKGFGTERLQEILIENLPEARIERFDRDAVKTFDKLKKCLDSFHGGEIDILVGTQMLSKGHNFKRVKLVMILGIDSQLNFPDFRSNEKVYQLLAQISGRSGRFGGESEVIIHTLGKNNSLFQYVKEHNIGDFYLEELKIRKLCDLPPFSKIIMIYLTSRFQDRVALAASRAQELLSNLQESYFNQVEILGPRPAIVEKKVNKYTWSLMLKSSKINDLHNILLTFKKNFIQRSKENRFKPDYSVSVKIDVDPNNLF